MGEYKMEDIIDYFNIRKSDVSFKYTRYLHIVRLKCKILYYILPSYFLIPPRENVCSESFISKEAINS